jgi:hypothetical protein
MEETQKRIQSTLHNLWKLRDNEDADKLNTNLDIIDTIKRGKRGLSMIPPKVLSENTKGMAYTDNRHSLDTLTYRSKDADIAFSHRATNSKDTSSIDSGISNCDIPDIGYAPLESKMQGMIDSVINVKNKLSLQKSNERENPKSSMHEENENSLTVKDFACSFKNLHANSCSDHADADGHNMKNKKNLEFHIVRELVTSEG